MKNFFLTDKYKRILSDTLTPVNIFLQIRERFPNSIILESSDYHSPSSGFSYIAFDPVACFMIDDDFVTQSFPDGTIERFKLKKRSLAIKKLLAFANSFKAPSKKFPFISTGLFGHMTYDSTEYFEDIEIQAKSNETAIPQILYRVYRYTIAINHFKDELYIFEHSFAAEGQEPCFIENGIDNICNLIQKQSLTETKPFKITSSESSNIEDENMRDIIKSCIKHCLRGDVFQIVPSRRFSRHYEGDDFNVYRALRSINPSPYLFYFDGGDYHIFGSSPEKQIFIQGNQAEIHPIAGTFRRTGDEKKDTELAHQLCLDEKESAEHVMLVDLARNDLSRNANSVNVEIFKEVQFFSHVIHLVSKVTATMNKGTNPLQLVADTFPAGTLSGAPKYNAQNIINQLEPTNRSIYGGAIGFMDFEGNFNHAIAIRTFLSKNDTLFYQAGMGVVAKSDVESEMNEVHLKLGALRKAIEMAEEI